jgi:hypothetical protein
MIDCEIWLAMNEDGDWIVATDESEALTKLGEDCGGYQARVVKITVKMTPPAMPETTVTIGDDVGTVVAQAEPDYG